MINTTFCIVNLLLSMFWLTGGVYILFLLLIIGGYTFYRISMNTIKGEKADLQRQLTERNELLQYATITGQKAREEADLTLRSKKKLLVKLSHEIRTPLNSMLGMTSLLNETTLTTEQREYVTTVLNSGEKLVSFINDTLMGAILTYSKAEPGKELAVKNLHANNIEEVLNVFVSTAAEPEVTTQKPESKMSVDFAKQYPFNILIAEDDAMNQQMVKMVLKKLGYEAQVAANGKEVLEVVSHKSFDLILMDVQMPEMDGLEATRMIRLCLEVQPAIIAMTANTMQGDRELCLEAGMNDYLSKPLKIKDLMAALEKQAKHHKPATAVTNL